MTFGKSMSEIIKDVSNYRTSVIRHVLDNPDSDLAKEYLAFLEQRIAKRLKDRE